MNKHTREPEFNAPNLTRDPYNFEQLLLDDAAYLKRMIAQELVEKNDTVRSIEPILKRGIEETDYTVLCRRYGEDVMNFARLIAYRRNDCKKWKQYIDCADVCKAQEIVVRNRYFVNCHFKAGVYDNTQPVRTMYYTPLHYVLEKARAESTFSVGSHWMVKALLNAGADPNVIDDEGNTPMHKVSTVDHITFLWECGAMSNIQNKNGNTPVMNIYIKDSKNHPVLRCLFGAGVDLNIQNDSGDTLLHIAVRHNDPTICYSLLCYGASYMIRNKENKTAICGIENNVALRHAIEPFMQKYIWEMLCKHKYDAIEKFMHNYPWMSFKVKDRLLLEWAEELCDAETVIFFKEQLAQLQKD